MRELLGVEHAADRRDPRRDIDTFLSVARLGRVGDTPAYQTLVGAVIEPGDPDDSTLFRLLSYRSDGAIGTDQTRPLATERVDGRVAR